MIYKLLICLLCISCSLFAREGHSRERGAERAENEELDLYDRNRLELDFPDDYNYPGENQAQNQEGNERNERNNERGFRQNSYYFPQ